MSNQNDDSTSPQGGGDDLAPVAWVLTSLHRALEQVSDSLRRFLNSAAPDAELLHLACQHLHQAAGALDMVQRPEPAKLLRAMEALTQSFVQEPGACTHEAVMQLEAAGAAVLDYLKALLRGKAANPVALFPQYRAMLQRLGESRIHPSDLWGHAWRWVDPAMPEAPPLSYGPALRARMDPAVLQWVKTGQASAARTLSDIALGLAQAAPDLVPRVFWKISAAYFEALALGLCPADVYAKRATSRILLQYAALARGETQVLQQLLQDLLFFCAQSVPGEGVPAPLLQSVRQAYDLSLQPPVAYEQVVYGRFNPVQLAQARKRIALASEAWAALVGGDTHRLRGMGEKLADVAESLQTLVPECGDLAEALTQAARQTVQADDVPAAPIAMEVATALLYLDATFEDADPADLRLPEHGRLLAQRLQQVLQGQPGEPLAAWMEEVYSRVAERQTLGGVVTELRAALGDVEAALDRFFRQPQDPQLLRDVPPRLQQMRGVFSVLGLEQATRALAHLHGCAERLLRGDVEPARQAELGEQLGNSLGALGFLIDMLSYQRALAHTLFVFDEAQGVFRPVMGRAPTATAPDALAVRDDLQAPSPQPPAPVEAPPAPDAAEETSPTWADRPAPVPMDPDAEAGNSDEAELRAIFLGEARQVLGQGREAWQALVQDGAALAPQTVLRRTFHTLKGSARMVGLAEFGEAAWAMEQLYNARLAHPGPLSADLLTLTADALQELQTWLEAIAHGDAASWRAEPLRLRAEALRYPGTRLDLTEGGEVEAAPAQSQDVGGPVTTTPMELEAVDFESLAGLSGPELAPTAGVQELAEHRVEPLPWPGEADDSLEAEAATAGLPDAEPIGMDPDRVKVIDGLHIDLPLYNVYLNEADEWSRQLQLTLGEWVLELPRAVPESTVLLAHALAGSSATVGFGALSSLAHALELALEHTRQNPIWQPQQAEVLLTAAESLRYLLHQFAAGFLKSPPPALMAALQEVLSRPATPNLRLVTSVPDEMDEAEEAEEGPALAATPVEPVPEPAPVDEGQADAPASALAIPADLGIEDAIDPELFPIFEQEAAELLPQLAAALRAWGNGQDDAGAARASVLRVLHTLKGSARLAGAMRLGEMAHRLESQVEPLAPQGLSGHTAAALLASMDAMQQAWDTLQAEQQARLSLPRPMGDARTALPPTPGGVTMRPPRVHAEPGQTVRVRARLLDRLLNQAGDIMAMRSRLDARMGQMRQGVQELGSSLERLRQHLRELELQTESQVQSRHVQEPAADPGFDPLEFDRYTQVQELTRMMAESVHDVATVQRTLMRAVDSSLDDAAAQASQARELQRDLLHTRMVEFDSIAERLHGVVRQAAHEADRQAQLEIRGGTLELDRSVLERMSPAFEHLLRNAVAHGIEPAEQRQALGKPAAGQLAIAVHQEGNDVAIAFQDDGRGLDVAAIARQARERGLLAEGEALTPQQAGALIFTPGFSTSTQLTALAGRGIGLDAVQAEVQALGGRIETDFIPGHGTRFTLVLPLTTAVTQLVLLRLGGLTLGVASQGVEAVLRVAAQDWAQALAQGSFLHDGAALPCFWGGALLQSSARSQEEGELKTLPVVICCSAGQRLALQVDEVLGHQEVVVKPLGPQLARLPGLAGMSVLPSGAVVMIYNPVALAAVYGQAAQALQRAAPSAALPAHTGAGLLGASELPLVLVVDDSITVRRVTQRLLKREGYRVALAGDGLQALDRLNEARPAVVLTDIEMPRMDGFDLVRSLRSDPRWQDLPVIMITSRTASKHRELAQALGVTHYLGKPYEPETLLALVRQYAALNPASGTAGS